MFDQLEPVTAYGHASECHSGEGDFILFDKIHVSTIELSNRQFQTFPDISLTEAYLSIIIITAKTRIH